MSLCCSGKNFLQIGGKIHILTLSGKTLSLPALTFFISSAHPLLNNLEWNGGGCV